MLKEFKAFAMKGNVLDLAVGVIIGGAFGKIVSSLVKDIIMPLIGLILGGVDFTKLVTPPIGKDNVVLNIGIFIQSVVDFLIISFTIFIFIKLINSFKKKEEVAEIKEDPKPTKEELLLTEIRDLLKERK